MSAPLKDFRWPLPEDSSDMWLEVRKQQAFGLDKQQVARSSDRREDWAKRKEAHAYKVATKRHEGERITAGVGRRRRRTDDGTTRVRRPPMSNVGVGASSSDD
jgi:hypothetical protein